MRRYWFWPAYLLLVLGIVLVGAEYISSFSVPSWPARALRPISMEPLKANAKTAVAEKSELIPSYNDWGVRDRPRSFARPADVRFRAVLVGDSFLEGYYIPAPIPELVERRWAAKGLSGMEAINLGVAATGPRQYLGRIKSVALGLDPDAIMVFVYVGNDLLTVRYDDFALPPLIDELPVPSILGAVAPRTTWLIVNRLGLSEVGINKNIPGEAALLADWVAQPDPEPVDRVARHMKEHYYPQLGEQAIAEVLLRGGGRLRTAAVKRPNDHESLQGWLLNGLIDWETSHWEVPLTPEEAAKMVGDSRVGETTSWLQEMERVVTSQRKRFVVAIAPVGTVDPEYAEFWAPWPRYYSYSLSSDARHRRLAATLRQSGMEVIDLRDALDGVRGTYRLTDGHWTDLGTQLVASRVADVLLAPRGKPTASAGPRAGD